MDLDNHHRNTQHGIHTACMGGTWLCLVQGFGGMRLQHHQLMFNPTLPKGLSHYRFKVRAQGRLIEVSVDASQAHYQLLEGAPITLQHGEHTIALGQDQAPVAAPLRSPTQ
jgi:alpha,alpha-trehalose phosphorylase